MIGRTDGTNTRKGCNAHEEDSWTCEDGLMNARVLIVGLGLGGRASGCDESGGVDGWKRVNRGIGGRGGFWGGERGKGKR